MLPESEITNNDPTILARVFQAEANSTYHNDAPEDNISLLRREIATLNEIGAGVATTLP